MTGQTLWVQALWIAFTSRGISLSRYVASQTIEHEREWSQPENSLLVQNFDNQQNLTNLNFIFVIISISALIKIDQHKKVDNKNFLMIFFSKGRGMKV